MNFLLLAESGQLIGVLLILAGAVGYLTIYYNRKFRGRGGDCCGSSCGIPLKRSDPEASASPQSGQAQSPPPQQFIPAENLADAAARHRREQDKKAG